MRVLEVAAPVSYLLSVVLPKNNAMPCKKNDSIHHTHKNHEMRTPVCDFWSYWIHVVCMHVICPPETFQLAFKTIKPWHSIPTKPFLSSLTLYCPSIKGRDVVTMRIEKVVVVVCFPLTWISFFLVQLKVWERVLVDVKKLRKVKKKKHSLCILLYHEHVRRSRPLFELGPHQCSILKSSTPVKCHFGCQKGKEKGGGISQKCAL